MDTEVDIVGMANIFANTTVVITDELRKKLVFQIHYVDPLLTASQIAKLVDLSTLEVKQMLESTEMQEALGVYANARRLKAQIDGLKWEELTSKVLPIIERQLNSGIFDEEKFALSFIADREPTGRMAKRTKQEFKNQNQITTRDISLVEHQAIEAGYGPKYLEAEYTEVEPKASSSSGHVVSSSIEEPIVEF